MAQSLISVPQAAVQVDTLCAGPAGFVSRAQQQQPGAGRSPAWTASGAPRPASQSTGAERWGSAARRCRVHHALQFYRKPSRATIQWPRLQPRPRTWGCSRTRKRTRTQAVHHQTTADQTAEQGSIQLHRWTVGSVPSRGLVVRLAASNVTDWSLRTLLRVSAVAGRWSWRC